jgi:hypothetical protein
MLRCACRLVVGWLPLNKNQDNRIIYDADLEALGKRVPRRGNKAIR